MVTYWITGHRFAEGHDRAICFVDVNAATNRLKDVSFPKEGSAIEWCDKCSAFHLTKLANQTKE